MNGPEHYAEAERLIARARSEFDDIYRDDSTPALLLAEAQVHATLAAAASNAVTVPLAADDEDPGIVYADPGWEGVLGFEHLSRNEGYTR